MRTRQSPYEIVADGSDEGGTSHWIVLFCERYWLPGVGGHGCGRRVASGGENLLPAQSDRFPSVALDEAFPLLTLFLINCFKIELVLGDLYPKRFDLTKGLLFDTFLITVWYE